MLKDPLDYTEDELNSLSTDDLRELFKESKNKESLYNTRQLSEKTLINSLYGALANKWFPLFNEDMAAAITSNGRYFIQKLANYIEDSLQNLNPSNDKYIVYGDTDSVYFTITPFMDKYQEKNPGLTLNEYVDWADSFEKKIVHPVITKCIDDFSVELNAFNKDVIGAEREIISDCAVFAEKKKYYARVRDSEGTRYPENDPYIKVMGLEVIKSSTPEWSKKMLREAIPIILDKSEQDVRQWINDIKQSFITEDVAKISSVGGVSRIDYDLNGKTTVPIGSRAAIKHNLYIKENGLEDKIAPIQAGDKCKRVYLQEPNKFNSNIIAFTNEQFCSEIKDCIDFDTQFHKGFLKPLELMTNCLGYDLERETQELDDW